MLTTAIALVLATQFQASFLIGVERAVTFDPALIWTTYSSSGDRDAREAESTEPLGRTVVLPAAPVATDPAPALAPEGLDLTMPALPIVMPLQASLSSDEAIGKVQGFYEKTQSLRALFRQTTINATFGRKAVSSGKVYIKKPGKMRWDYYGKKNRSGDRRVKKSFISDGEGMWAVFHDNKEVYVQNLKKDLLPVAITFLYGKGDLRRDFTSEYNPKVNDDLTLGDQGDIVLKLTPKQASAQYKYLWLVVDPKNYRVKQSLVLTATGDINWFRFFNPDTDSKVTDGWFTFNARKHPDYKVIDAEEVKKRRKRKK